MNSPDHAAQARSDASRPPADGVTIERAVGSHVLTADGRMLIDLMNGFGAVFMGHAHPRVIERVDAAMRTIWACGRLRTPVLAEAITRVGELLPQGLVPAGFYSTGMEVAEFALRLAAARTGRQCYAGFARAMHGKSAYTANLCWHNAPVRCEQATILPFLPEASEEQVLGQLHELLRRRTTAAVFVEPIQGSNGAHEATPAFYEAVVASCRAFGTLCVFDEILTGLYRTGTRFYVDRLAVVPDVLLFAKSMGNGFPVSAIAVRDDLGPSTPAMLPGSTFSDHPLAAAAVVGTLDAMEAMAMEAAVARIERTVVERLGGREDAGLRLRGRGALHALELAPGVSLPAVLDAVDRSGVLVSAQGRCIRLLPAATIGEDLLGEACERIAAACLSVGPHKPSPAGSRA
jgi:acetylornithine/succinyldiaminopimelate/putrescine aminotransferase